MALITATDISISFGGSLLLDQVNLRIEPHERICLVGRNGEGKTTLLRILTSDLVPDAGNITYRKGLKIGGLAQEVAKNLSGTVLDVVSEGLKEQGDLIAEHHRLSIRLAKNGSDAGLLQRLDRVQHALDAGGGWLMGQQAEKVLEQMRLDPDAHFSVLSAGQKRRVLLAKAFVNNPDVLVLDEPTNHLDLESIVQLEDLLRGFSGTVFFVTHDRMLIRHLATRILELDRARLSSFACDYHTFLQRRQAMLDNEAEKWSKFDKKLAQEETWIRQGIKARRTRNEGRVRALVELRQQRLARRNIPGRVQMRSQHAERTGKRIIEAENVTFGFEGLPIIHGFSTTVMRGDKVGIIGPNGVGKTTLLQLLLGNLSPQQGDIRLGSGLKIAYFDQLRAQLDENKTVQDNISEGNDTILFNGKPKHVLGYLQDFLFSPDRARSPVRILSGGERNRLLLARLFTVPSNVLVLDEPTNDLDMETLELLEELLLEYQGTVFLVSHDRAFLNNVVTHTFVFEGLGRIREYVGGYDDWIRQRKPEASVQEKPVSKPEKKRRKTEQPRKMTYKELKELEALPGLIEDMENEQQALYQAVSEPDFYKNEKEIIAESISRLSWLEDELKKAYQRWEVLEDTAVMCK